MTDQLREAARQVLDAAGDLAYQAEKAQATAPQYLQDSIARVLAAIEALDAAPPAVEHSHYWVDGELQLNGCALPHATPPAMNVERLADLLMDLRMDGPAAEGWTYQQAMRHYAENILARLGDTR
jgi:hypothetical protein